MAQTTAVDGPILLGGLYFGSGNLEQRGGRCVFSTAAYGVSEIALAIDRTDEKAGDRWPVLLIGLYVERCNLDNAVIDAFSSPRFRKYPR